ncbi:MAG TPA: DUF6458 family protein [Egibacteraceae bacterium]|nr:DUF6458 family protein [Actinomycetota bacterium]HWB71615.1 DUF6458 family protein [Egibacteraceae bacterium]
MTIGGSIALIIIGAILAFAVDFQISGIDIQVIGVILMIGGLIGLVFGLSMFYRGRGRGSVVEERRVVDDRDVY